MTLHSGAVAFLFGTCIFFLLISSPLIFRSITTATVAYELKTGTFTLSRPTLDNQAAYNAAAYMLRIGQKAPGEKLSGVLCWADKQNTKKSSNQLFQPSPEKHRHQP